MIEAVLHDLRGRFPDVEFELQPPRAGLEKHLGEYAGAIVGPGFFLEFWGCEVSVMVDRGGHQDRFDVDVREPDSVDRLFEIVGGELGYGEE